jgi:hypothetical protein
MAETVEQKHIHASGGTYADTETTVRYNPGSNVAYVRVRCLPGLYYWSRPEAGIMREWVDAAIKESGMKRDGARVDMGYVTDGWSYNYYLKSA